MLGGQRHILFAVLVGVLSLVTLCNILFFWESFVEKLTTTQAQDEVNWTRDRKFITYRIFQGLNLTEIETTVCDNRGFHESLSKPGILDFHAQIKTNLNILYVGSSVGNQFTRSLSRAVMRTDRQIIRWSWNRGNENTQISLTPDGGTVAGIRVTGLFLKRGKDNKRSMAPQGGGGWLSHDVREMKRLVHQWRQVEPIDTGYGEPTSPCEVETKNANVTTNVTTGNPYPCEEKNFDIVVHQLPVEWDSRRFPAFPTNKDLNETAGLSFDYLGASTVILQTSPITNNIQDLGVLVATNQLIWDYAQQFEAHAKESMHNSTTPKRQILVMDVFAYSVFLFLQNSIEIGLIPKKKGEELKARLNETADYNEFLNLSMALQDVGAFNQTIRVRGQTRHVGQYCGDLKCHSQSMISYDGMHWCMQETGGRLDAGLACLIQCSLHDDAGAEAGETTRACERSCNTKYMSLVPVPWERGQKLDAFNVSTRLTGLENY